MQTLFDVLDLIAYCGGLGAAVLIVYAVGEALHDRYRVRKGLGLRSISG